jgi:hypothetical protein
MSRIDWIIFFFGYLLAGINLSWLDEAGIYKPNHTPFGAGILDRELYT